jgi:hypothetical protein
VPTSTPRPVSTSTPVVAANTPTSTPTAQPTPALTLKVKLSPRRVARGKKLRVDVSTLPAAQVTVTLTYRGTRTAKRQARANSNGSYRTTFRISKKAKTGKATVRVRVTFESQTVAASAQATIK